MVTEEELDVRNTGIYPKFDILVSGGDSKSKWWTSFIYRHYLEGIKSKRFQKLVLLLYMLSFPSSDAGMSDILKNRVNEIKKKDSERYHREIQSWSYKEEGLSVLEIEEIMEILGVSRISAIDYKNTLKAIMYFYS